MRTLFKFLLRLARCTSGSALIEMTIIVPVAISLMAGAVDFGLAFSTQAIGSKSVRDAARFLGSLPAGTGCPGWAVTRAQYLVLYGKPSQGSAGTELITGWTNLGDVTATCAGSVVTVTATIPYNSIILASFLPIANTYTLSAQHKERQVGG
jgi:hypothetical protein